MYAHQLIGKNALRTKPNANKDHSYMTTPVKILAATENHIVYKHIESYEGLFGNRKSILDYRWNDDNWTDYDELMSLTGEKHIELMSELNELS